MRYLLLMFGVILLFACTTSRNIPRSIVTWSEANVWKVVVRGGSMTGSSFYLSENTWLTACHVVKGQSAVYIQSADRSESVVVKVTVCDEDYDMALLQSELIGLNMMPTFFGSAERGTVVYAPGYPLGLPMVITEGHWQSEGVITAPTIYGDSGSPVLTVIDGRVVVVGIRLGVIRLTQPVTHLGIATVSENISEFIKKPR